MAYLEFVITMVVFGFIFSFILSVGIGANDVGNSFGTVYGNRSLSFRKIIVLAAICEMSGAILVGSKVASTIRNGIISLDNIKLAYENKSNCKIPFSKETGNPFIVNVNGHQLGCHDIIHIIGNIAILFSCLIVVNLANYFKMPGSGTHMVVGSTVGYGLVALQGTGIKWQNLMEIMILWVFSPIISGIFSAFICFILDKILIHRSSKQSLKLMVIITFMFLTIFVFFFSLLFKGSHLLKFDLLPWWVVVLISGSFALLFCLITRIFLVPRFKDHSQDAKYNAQDETVTNIDKSIEPLSSEPEGGYLSSKLLTWLQILTACNKSFAHGGNDVSNSIAPLMSIWLIYSIGEMASQAPTNIFLLLFGSIGIVFGVTFWGKRVMRTIGRDITKITPISGFSIEFSSSTTVLIMTLFALPVSTTHCTVGSTVSVSWLRFGFKSVKYQLLLSILICWIVSVPFPALISAGVFALIREIVF